MSYRYHIGVFIGRFQPFHQGHEFIIRQGLKSCRQIVLMMGSVYRARSVKNPFTFEERVALIKQALPDVIERIHIEPIEDTMYREQAWIDAIRTAAKRHTNSNNIALISHDKDASSYYLKYFANWDQVNLPNYKSLDATAIRHAWLTVKQAANIAHIPGLTPATQTFLQDQFGRDVYQYLQDEYRFLCHYKAQWADTPYPVLFNTTDAIVICEGHILLVQRKCSPGKGLWALPGGFLEVDEWIHKGLVRELVEETSIDLPTQTLLQHLTTLQAFDHPSRSQIGRVITQCGVFHLPGQRPAVKAADDALATRWVALDQWVDYRDQLHDDHYYIVKTLQSQGKI